MNPYDRRAVEQVWRRVCPDRDVFAKGGKPPEALPELTVGQQLLLLAQGYERLAEQCRCQSFRRMAMQCRRGADGETPPAPMGTVTREVQRQREAMLRRTLYGTKTQVSLLRESQCRARQLAGMKE